MKIKMKYYKLLATNFYATKRTPYFCMAYKYAWFQLLKSYKPVLPWPLLRKILLAQITWSRDHLQMYSNDNQDAVIIALNLPILLLYGLP